ncbi:MAG: DNA repair protein RecO [Lachnospiraceae bacterium]|nr:DNA repair protein RecO [Lachnospiraceae bacterium]
MTDNMEVTGIVLTAMPIGEADRRILLLTKELGKISAFVRGARKPTSPMVASTRPFAFGRFEIYPGKSAYTVRKCEILEYFEGLVSDVSKTAYGSYMLELAGYFSHEDAPAGEMLELLYYSLKALLHPQIPDRLVRRIFELKALSVEGVVPDFRTCIKCRKPVKEGIFRPSVMNVVCTDCAQDLQGNALPSYVPAGLPLSKSALYTLQFIAATPPPKLYTFSLNEETFAQIVPVIDRLYAANVDRTLQSRQMLSVLAE